MAVGSKWWSWTGSGETLRHRGVALSIFLIAGLLMVMGGGKSVVSVYDNLVKPDRLLAISLILTGVPDDANPVTLLDVDNTTRVAWRADGATPHAALAELARIATERQPLAVMVDFDLSMERHDSLADPAMAEFLSTYPADAPLLMISRRIIFSGMGDETGAAATPATPYDGAVTGKANVLWVSALNRAGGDRSVKEVLLWQSVCDGAAGETYPSPALAVAAKTLPADFDLRAFLKARARQECGNANPAAAPMGPPQRMVSLPYVFGDDARSRSQFRILVDGTQTVAVRRISAGQLVRMLGLSATTAGEVDADPFAGRIVIIGASYSSSGDMHQTPLGMMPGSIIIANTLLQAKALVESRPVQAWVRTIVSLVLLVIFAVLARMLVPIAAVTGIFVVSLLALLLCARLLGFEDGFAILALAFSGFAVFKFVDMIVQLALLVPKRGWRVLLKR